MYPLGKQFEIDYSKAKSDHKAIVEGSNYRITIISERIVRLEFSPSGNFLDKPTQLIKKRNIGLPDYSVRQDKHVVEISTKYFVLTYLKGKPFLGTTVDPMKYLKITLASKERDRRKDWYVGHPEAKNLMGNMVGVDVSLPANLQKGLYSLDGFASIDDSFSKIIAEDGTLENPLPHHFDMYVFMYDKDFRLALYDYFKMTGAPALIPRYALGNWWSRNTIYTDETLHNLLLKFEKEDIPFSVLLLDHDWHLRNVGEFKKLKAGYTFNNELIRDPVNMINEFHSKGVKVGLIINPTEGFYPHEQYYPQAAQYLGVNNGSVIPFDPLNPRHIDVMFKMFLHPLEALGVDFFWNDSTGNMDITNLWSLNHYLYLDASREGEERALILGRGSVTAPHRYPVLYGGSSEISWKKLQEIPFMYLNAANIGVSWWSHDVGGNHGGMEDSELFIRYVQLSTFSPILRFHGARGRYYKKEPWVWDAKTLKIVGDYLRLRHRLIPYLYTEAYNYTKSGTPLIQPFYYNYMWVYDDPLFKNQYYFGSQLLVCPILEKKDNIMNRTIHRFFVPEGVWYDLFTGKKFPGNKKYISFFKEDDYPVFAHEGSIVPFSNKSDVNNIGLPTDIEIHFFPGASNTYTLYEDDGITTKYREGYFLKTNIDYNYITDNYTIMIRSVDGKTGIAPDRRNYKLVLRNSKMPTVISVFFNNNAIKYEQYVDGNDFIIELKDIPTIGQLTVNCQGQDLEIDSIRLINDELDSILMDLQIETYTKEEIAKILFSNDPIDKKRIAIRKLNKNGLSKEHIDLFLKLFDYIGEV
ncbi:MAG: DUF5110 domain-containing protein [Bacilli bacterium]|nr:DUF5110 domain-containing protein [Bacilli bacterium]